LALNAGHIDPGFHGPITIKLINLRSTVWTFKLGDPIFTIVFHTLDQEDDTIEDFEISKKDTENRVYNATDISLDNALYDLALLREFVKEKEMGRALKIWFFKTFWGFVTLLVGLLAAIASIIKIWEYLKNAGIIK